MVSFGTAIVKELSKLNSISMGPWGVGTERAAQSKFRGSSVLHVQVFQPSERGRTPKIVPEMKEHGP